MRADEQEPNRLSSSRRKMAWSVWAVLVLGLCCLTACEAPDQPEKAQQAAQPAVATTATAPSVNTPASRSELETAEARNEAAFATSVALTPPIDKIPETPGTPRPTATTELGDLLGCNRATPREPIPLSCWREVYDGHFVDIQSGRYFGKGAEAQGYIMVNVWPGDYWSGQGITFYETPQVVGGVRIVSIDGTLVTLVTEDGQHTFEFDVATRQWISSNPVPTEPATPTWSGATLDATTLAIYNTLPTLSPNPRSEPTKDAEWRQSQLWDVAAQTAIVLYPPSTPIEYPQLYTPLAHDPWPTAILHTRSTAHGVIYDDPFRGPPCSFILDSNHWYGTSVGENTHVCAGADKDRNAKGAIVIEIWYSGDQRPTYSGHYLTPSDQGAVRIQDVVGDQVILVSTNNTIFYFDLATRQWASGTTGPSPSVSVSPIPSVSPLPTQQP